MLIPPLAFAQAGGPANDAQKEAKQVVAAVEDTLQRHAQDVHTCFGKALADRLDVSGKLDLEVTVGTGGRVKGVAVESKGPLVTDALASCVTEAAKTWRIDGIEPGASVVLPLSFSAQANQFVVKADDAPLRGPQPRGKTVPPFQVKILADPENVRARELAVTDLMVSPANRVAMHRHPGSAKVLYVLKGALRVLGPAGQEPLKLVEGDAVLIPRGYPHVIENMGRQIPAEMLQVFAGPGPEKVYRDPQDPAGRAAFEVLRGPPPKAAPESKLVVVRPDDRPAASTAGGKASVRVLLDPESTGTPAVALSVLQMQPGAALARQTHDRAEQFLWVTMGGGVLKVGNEDHPFTAGQALFVPPGQPYALSFTRDEPSQLVQIFAPAGPEQKLKGAAPADAAPASNKQGAPVPPKPEKQP